MMEWRSVFVLYLRSNIFLYILLVRGLPEMFYCYSLKANRCFSFRSIEQFIIICYFSM